MLNLQPEIKVWVSSWFEYDGNGILPCVKTSQAQTPKDQTSEWIENFPCDNASGAKFHFCQFIPFSNRKQKYLSNTCPFDCNVQFPSWCVIIIFRSEIENLHEFKLSKQSKEFVYFFASPKSVTLTIFCLLMSKFLAARSLCTILQHKHQKKLMVQKKQNETNARNN